MSNLYLRLAKTNIRNNRQLYLPYLISGIVTVAMFYLMIFINNNPGMKTIPGAANLKMIMSMGVGIIAIFACIFIFYTNSFIIKNRKKEIGVYNILGMEKRHIAKVLGQETFFVAVIAIAGGVLSGIVFSKLILMLLYRMLGFQESVSFYVAKAGIEYTILVFGFVYVLTLLYNLLQIRLANPIELLRGGNVGEKEPKTKVLMAIAGITCLTVAYYIAITTENPMEVLTKFFLAVLLVIIGTYLLFTAGSIAILKMLRKNKKFYYNKKHFAAVSGMLYRMKQNAAGLASICVLSTMVLVMISMTVSMFAGVDDEPEAGKVNIYSKTPYNQSTIQLYGQTYAVDQTFSYESENDSFMVLDGSIYVVADESVLRQIFDLQKAAGMNADGSSMLSMYQTEISFEYDGTKEEKLACAEALSKAMESGENTHTSYLESRTENEKDFYVLYGGLFFLGLFLGIMFLMVTVMIIFYKQISEGYDDRERYIIMEKVGMSHAEVKATIQSQIRIVFFLPLVMAAIHVAAAFPMIRRLLAMLNLTNVPLFVTCLVVTILIFTAIYYLVFRITSKAYDKIVSK